MLRRDWSSDVCSSDLSAAEHQSVVMDAWQLIVADYDREIGDGKETFGTKPTQQCREGIFHIHYGCFICWDDVRHSRFLEGKIPTKFNIEVNLLIVNRLTNTLSLQSFASRWITYPYKHLLSLVRGFSPPARRPTQRRGTG